MTMNSRPDVYRRVHRGLRKALFDLAYTAGRTVWSDRDDVARLQAAFLDTLSFLKKHGEMEDTFHLPLLESKMPGITEHDSGEHEAIELAIEDLEASLAAATIAPESERASVGETFYHRLCIFVASYLEHMAHEETVTMPLFHRYCTDEEIVDASRRLIAALGPEESALAMRYMIPALDRDDRITYLRMVTATVPPAAVATVMGIAESTLSPVEWEQALTVLEPIGA
jgi:hypothetical protein